MARFLKKQKKEIGISPDELLFRGEQKINEVILGIIDFDSKNLVEDTLNNVYDVLKYQIQCNVSFYKAGGLESKNKPTPCVTSLIIECNVGGIRGRNSINPSPPCVFNAILADLCRNGKDCGKSMYLFVCIWAKN